MAIAWTYLIVAGLFEIGWPIGLKWAQQPGRTIVGIIVAVVAMAISGLLLYLAQRDIPLGTSYAVWTGIGTVGTALLGIAHFAESFELLRVGCILLIVIGIVGLRLLG